MDVEMPDRKFKNVFFNDASYREWLERVSREIDQKNSHLCLFIGFYDPDKNKALKDLEKKLNRKVQIIDADELVSRIESETFKNMDELFGKLSKSDDIIYLRNGGRLCGAYTGYTHSKVKYATPQERYFLKKVQAFRGLTIIDIEESTDADTTLRRAAHSVIAFPLPESKFKRFIWHLKHYSFNGYDIRSIRPDEQKEMMTPND